ncbi:unnamed protein product, partial [Porites lobata]
EVSKYRAQLFAESTKATYQTHRDTYLRFCHYMGYSPVPVQPTRLLHYAAFLARNERQAAKVFTYNSFVLVLRRHLASLGFDPKLYAGHSFRRGGASFAYHSEVPIELIKALGD